MLLLEPSAEHQNSLTSIMLYNLFTDSNLMNAFRLRYHQLLKKFSKLISCMVYFRNLLTYQRVTIICFASGVTLCAAFASCLQLNERCFSDYTSILWNSALMKFRQSAGLTTLQLRLFLS
jgi:hypothetical protein